MTVTLERPRTKVTIRPARLAKRRYLDRAATCTAKGVVKAPGGRLLFGRHK
jgi:hypothetical protein